ncbi:urease accessory protein UreF [Pseudophaeobacter sp. EL27]|uniref:urease accessory protein UreF n=1 Tax=Pseudophaeobacter sp. EL27 TaxID=2107580 RepID=UPI000EFAD6BF|nr:urease accessory UreF family protein [Pseudophaeobacter sp. EL27]
MLSNAKLLTLTQWLSPAFPLGSFAYSHGLEQAIHSGWIAGPSDLQDWLEVILRHGSAHSDAVWIRLAHDAETAAEIEQMNTQCRAYAASFERLREAERQGQAFARVVSEVWSLTLPALQLPIALGRAARLSELPIDLVVTLYLQAFLGNLVSAAQRLMPLGQTDAQAILSRLNMDYIEISAQTVQQGLDDISSSAFLSDIAAMRHETLQPRIFQS